MCSKITASLTLAFMVSGSAAFAAPSPLGTIPLEPYLRAQATLHAEVNGRAGTFMFDTGEGVSSISPSFATAIGCRPWGRISGFRMGGDRLDSARCDDLRFYIDNLQFTAPIAGVLDIMSFLGPDVPQIDGAIGLDIFAGQVLTIEPRREIVLESPKSLAVRIKHARELRVRIVRDVEGVALAVDAAVQTPDGFAWMELDTGNGGSLVVANHVAPLLGMKTDTQTPTQTTFYLAGGIAVTGLSRTRDLIMDGNIGAQFLNHWNLTLDLSAGRAWLSPAS